MKKIISIALSLAFILSITACSKKDNDISLETTTAETTPTTSITTIETTAETTTAKPVTETTAETTTAKPVTETTTKAQTESKVDKIVFDQKAAIAKVNKMVEAHDVLVSQKKDVENKFLDAAENLNGELAPDIKTSDSISLYDAEGQLSVSVNYFYDYVNNGVGYYDFENYVKSNKYKDINNKYLFDGYNKYLSTELIMTEAIGLIPYIKKSTYIKYGNLIEEKKITMQKCEVFYSMTMDCDTNGGNFIVLFDKTGNLLNIIPANDNFDGYITTF